MMPALLPFLLAMTPLDAGANTAVVEALVERHNAHDAVGMVELMADDVALNEIYTGTVFSSAREIGEVWARRFETLPELEIIIEHRVTLGNRVIDHEIYCEGPPGQPCEQLISIYTIEDGLITAIDLVQDPTGSTVPDPRPMPLPFWTTPLAALGAVLALMFGLAIMTRNGRGLMWRLATRLSEFLSLPQRRLEARNERS